MTVFAICMNKMQKRSWNYGPDDPGPGWEAGDNTASSQLTAGQDGWLV